jgi:hypothetical protein
MPEGAQDPLRARSRRPIDLAAAQDTTPILILICEARYIIVGRTGSLIRPQLSMKESNSALTLSFRVVHIPCGAPS